MRQILKWLVGLMIGYWLILSHQFYGLEVLLGCAVAYPIQLSVLVILLIAAFIGYRKHSVKHNQIK